MDAVSSSPNIGEVVCLPDIGDFHDVPVIEILVRPGERVAVGDPIVMLESDKATMEVPSPSAGTVADFVVKPGDRVSKGSPLLLLDVAEASVADQVSRAGARGLGDALAHARGPEIEPSAGPPAAAPPTEGPGDAATDARSAYCGPAVRRLARELGVDLGSVSGSGPRGRILMSDVQAHVKQLVRAGSVEPGRPVTAGQAPSPRVDFAKFGPVERRPLARVQRISAANLARNWTTIPHVTNHHEADVTELDAFRRQLKQELGAAGAGLTLLPFVLKACAAALREHPGFNASLDGEDVVLKGYVHIGFAVDTPDGLVVPVLRDADRKGVVAIAQEAAQYAERARAARLTPGDIQGGCFTVSSLGPTGGSYFTPIINAPESAILGVSAAVMRAVWNGREFTPRLMLPLSLSWDHRVIDGVAAARFNDFLVRVLGDFRRIAL